MVITTTKMIDRGLGASAEGTTSILRHSATIEAVMGSIIETITEVVIISRLHSATTITITWSKPPL